MCVKEIARKYKDAMIKLRREFHMYPEPSLQEYKTSKRIKNELDKLGIPYVSLDETGIMATIKGPKEGKTILLRADIDGLSVTEKNDVDYKSKNEGYMHACGHDCHITSLLGAAMILNDVKDEINGTVKLLFQPAEEVALGAKNMIKAGALEGVDGVFGMHVWSDLKCGEVCVEEGPRMASADLFKITVKGKGGHGSAPQQGIDAAVVSSAIVMNLQSIVSRELSPFEPAVVSVGLIKAGSRFNVIASDGILEGTTRCFNPEIKERFPKLIERIAKDTAKAYRAEAELEYTDGTNIVINNPECSKIAEEAVRKIGAKPTHLDKIAGGEDFAEYMSRVPSSVFAIVGVRNDEKGACYPQHNPNYNVDEDALEIGSGLYAQYALDFLNK